MTSQNRVVRVFISSTFRDMHAEPEELVKFAFLELRWGCWERQVEFVDVDFRWGSTDEQKTEGKVLPPVWLKLLSPAFFIGLLREG